MRICYICNSEINTNNKSTYVIENAKGLIKKDYYLHTGQCHKTFLNRRIKNTKTFNVIAIIVVIMAIISVLIMIIGLIVIFKQLS